MVLIFGNGKLDLCPNAYMWNLKKKIGYKINLPTKEKIVTDVEKEKKKNLMITKGEMREEINLEIGIDICTLIYI